MNSLYSIITLFALGAIFGLYLLTLLLRKKETPKLVTMIHGALVALAFVLLIKYASQMGSGLLGTITFFSIAIVFGLTLIYRDLTGKSLPLWFAVCHGLLAVTGFILLVVYAF
ncbi:MAG: hypothetical protein A3F72_21595 [Bacteroidetes bacterium RIFCSPLOWO2_12_FULL_35_15]|nr:MAG: hypothetical protein A3F72_21595 [Bacteroidetes bacterium RIFCSPLOWO2_12_FULL_35_15]